MRAPVYKIHGEDYDYLFEQIRVNGYRRARIDGKPRDLGDHIELDEDQAHTVEAVIDSFVVGPGIDQQVVTSLEHGLKLGDGLARLSYRQAEAARRGRTGSSTTGSAAPGTASSPARCTRPSSRLTTRSAHAQLAPGIGTAMRVHPSLLVPDPNALVERGGLRRRRDEQQPRQLGRPDALQSRRALRIQPRTPPLRIWPRSTSRCCFTGRRGSSSKSCCRRGRRSGSSTPARRSSSTASSINWSITTASTASRARPTPAWTNT